MKALLLTNDKRALFKTVDSHGLEFYHKRKLYAIDPEAIGLNEVFDDLTHIPEPMALYFENSSNPVSFSPDEERDPSMDLMDRFIAINAIRQLNEPEGLNGFFNSMGGLVQHLTLYNIFIGIVALTLAGALLSGWGLL